MCIIFISAHWKGWYVSFEAWYIPVSTKKYGVAKYLFCKNGNTQQSNIFGDDKYNFI